MAAGAEGLQRLTGRSGNWADFLRGACGILAVAAWYGWPACLTVQQAAASRPARAGGGLAHWLARSWRPLLLTALLLIWPLAEAYPILVDAWSGWRQFPVIASFSGQCLPPRGKRGKNTINGV